MMYRIKLNDGRYLKGIGNHRHGNYHITTDATMAATFPVDIAVRIAKSCGGTIEPV